jgi:hypothetical protein
MDSTIDTTKERLSVLDQPPTSHVSLILNGVFNGATLAGLPFAAYELSHKVKGIEAPNPLTKTTMFAVVAGAAVGAWFGAREANNLTTYQTAVSEEIRKLRADVDAHAQAHTQHAR